MSQKKYPLPEERDESIDDITLLEPTATYSYADYIKWTFQERVELIKGKIFKMAPAPSRKHQKISMNLSGIIAPFLKDKPCEAYHAPFDVRLPNDLSDEANNIYSVVQPDLCIICNHAILDAQGCNGAPDIVIEILSPGTKQKDLNQKYALYEENRIKEYWVIYPIEEVVHLHTINESGKYASPTQYTLDSAITSPTLPHLKIKVSDIFD